MRLPSCGTARRQPLHPLAKVLRPCHARSVQRIFTGRHIERRGITAKAIGVELSTAIQLRADEVIE
jgi:hypothetical protein